MTLGSDGAGGIHSRTSNRLLAVATVILAATALKLSQPVLLPVTLGVFLVIVVWPLEAWLERQLWRWVAVFVTTLLVLLSLSALTYALVRSVEQLAVRGPCSR